MSSVWLVVGTVGLGTVAIKALGPVLLGGRPLPDRATGLVELLAPALSGHDLGLISDAGCPGVAV